MKTEKEIRETLEILEKALMWIDRLGSQEPRLNTFKLALVWMLEDAESN